MNAENSAQTGTPQEHTPGGDEAMRQIAASLEAPESLLPHLPELLADLDELGSHPRVIVDLLRHLPALSSVLDLGCGKGAVALRLARELRFQVLGIDLFAPFVDEARRRARSQGVDDLCRFETADMREALARFSGVDAVIYAALGNALGDLETCVALLRGAVRPGGFIVLDDGFLKNGTPIARKGYETTVPREEALRQLSAFGDVLEAEVIIPAQELRRANVRNNRLIRRRADELSKRRPDLAPMIDAYVQNQLVECETLETRITEAVWLLRRR